MNESEWTPMKLSEPVGENSAETRKSSSSRKKETERQLEVMLLSNRFEVRGSSAQTLVLAENLRDYGIRPTIITPHAGSVAPSRRKHLSVNEYRYLMMPLVSRLVLRFITQDFADSPPDLIHIQTHKMLPYGMYLARQFHCPYVVTFHDFLPPGEVLHFDRPLGQNLIAVSSSVKSALLTQPAITGNMVKVIHSGVEHIPDERAGEVLAPHRSPVIGTAGPLELVKGTKYFLDAAAIVLKQFPHVEFLVAGSGPEERNLRQRVRALGISKQVTFVSKLYGFQEPLHAMDIFCLPSLQQGLGTIMLEAMAWGRPVVASNVGGISSALDDGKTGLLVPPANHRLLADKLLELLRHPELAREIGSAGRNHVRKNFRVDQTVRLVTDVYRSVLAEFKASNKNKPVATAKNKKAGQTSTPQASPLPPSATPATAESPDPSEAEATWIPSTPPTQ